MSNLNQLIISDDSITYCHYCLLKLANNEVIAHFECEKEINKPQNKPIKPIFRLLFRSEEKDFRENLNYWPFLSRNPRVIPKNDLDDVCVFSMLLVEKENKQRHDLECSNRNFKILDTIIYCTKCGNFLNSKIK